MASFRDKYRNPDAPPGYRDENPPKTEPLPEVYHNPDAPPGMYRFEAEPNCYKIYFPMKDFVINLEPLLDYLDADIADNLSDFIIQTPDEDSASSGEKPSKIGSDIEVIGEKIKDISVTSKQKPVADVSSEKSKKSKSSSKKTKHSDRKRVEVESDSSNASYSHHQRKKYKKKRKKRLSRSPSPYTASEDERKRRVKLEQDDQIRAEDDQRRRLSQERDIAEDTRRQPIVPYQENESSLDEGSVKRVREQGDESSGEDRKKAVKGEQIDEPDHLYGSYVCTVCSKKMTSEVTYQSHMSGKKHMKALNAKNVASTVLKTVPKREERSKYPPPNPGIRRVQVKDRAIIQNIVEQRLKTPCPGLEQVIEIQNLDGEAHYYCALCDSSCSTNCILPHLGGFKHQLKCLKFFYRELYEKYNYEPKYKIERTVMDLLVDVQRKYGMGRITVEREYSDNIPPRSKGDTHQPGPSYEPEIIICDETEMPDQTKAGFYCNLCQSHMNNQIMWVAHINGKRHLANKKKAPGSAPSKLKFVPVNARAYIMDTLDRVPQPIVGLDHLRETQNHENQSEIYQCQLCCASLTHIDVVEHLLTQKHRRKYLEKIQHPDLVLLENMNYRETECLIADLCTTAERELGRGRPSVFVSRSSVKP